MRTKLIKLIGVLVIWLISSSPVWAAEAQLRTAESAAGAKSAAQGNTYTNPLSIQIPRDGLVESCAEWMPSQAAVLGGEYRVTPAPGTAQGALLHQELNEGRARP